MSHHRSQTFLSFEDIGAYPLGLGADDQGRTNVSAVRFFQEWTRSTQDVLALRSQFSLGLNVLGATINNDGEPDSRCAYRFSAYVKSKDWYNLHPLSIWVQVGTTVKKIQILKFPIH